MALVGSRSKAEIAAAALGASVGRNCDTAGGRNPFHQSHA